MIFSVTYFLGTQISHFSEMLPQFLQKSNVLIADLQKWLDATTQLLADDPSALQQFVSGDMRMFMSSQFNRLGGVAALSKFEQRDKVFEALRQSMLVRQSTLTV